MTVEQQVLEKLRSLPPERQHEVLEFLERLDAKDFGTKPRPSLRGLWKDLNISVTEGDLAEARREMWGDFPRAIPT